MAILEIAVAVQSRGEGRVQEGDIVAARKPLGYVGKKEQGDLLWLLIDTNLTPAELMEQDVDAGMKRKRSIRLESLLNNDFQFDLTKVKNPAENYQPGFEVSPIDGRFGRTPSVKQIDHLIREKTRVN